MHRILSTSKTSGKIRLNNSATGLNKPSRPNSWSLMQ